MAVLVDANVVVSFLIHSEKTEEAKLVLGKIEEPVIALNVVEEIIYVGLSLIYGVRSFKLKEKIFLSTHLPYPRFLYSSFSVFII